MDARRTILQTSTPIPVRRFLMLLMSISEGVEFVIVSSQPYIETRREIWQTTTDCHRQHICQIQMDRRVYTSTHMAW